MSPHSLLHVLLVSFTAQGHVKPLLRLGKKIASKGLLVTFSAPQIVGKKMRNAGNFSEELTAVGDGFMKFEFFEDGWDEDEPRRTFLKEYLPQLEVAGKKAILVMMKKNADQGTPVSCLIYNPFIPWVADVAETLGRPSAMLWFQSCACFEAYYHYFNGPTSFPDEENPEIDVELPFMPLLKHDEIPSMLHPRSHFASFRGDILCQFKNIGKPSYILMDTFQDLESEVIDYMSKFFPIMAVGPLFKNLKKLNADINGDVMKVDDCLEWLDSKPLASVVYISFGSIVTLKQEQIQELAYGLVNAGVYFLWHMKPNEKLPEELPKKAGETGKIVRWCPQEEVLAHPATACFISHCGCNSALEALTSGIPVITFPQFGDQVINAKFLVDVYKTGVRMFRGELDTRLITRDKVEKCVRKATVGRDAVEMKNNALKWKELADAAVAEGGSSDRSIEAFVDDLKRRSVEILSTRFMVEKVVQKTETISAEGK